MNLAEWLPAVASVLAAAISAWSAVAARRAVQRAPRARAGETRYLVRGTNEEGERYSGVAFVKIKGQRCRIREFIADEIFHGVGEVKGRRLEILIGTDLVHYEMREDGELVGAWGQGAVETLTPIGQQEKPRIHQAS